MELSQEDGTLVGLSSLGPDRYFKWPGEIAEKATGKTEPAARTFDRVVLENLAAQGLSEKTGEAGYAITQAGADRVLEVFITASPAVHILAGLAGNGISIGIHWIEDHFRVVAMVGSTPHIADDRELGKAILAVKRAVEKTLVKI